MKAFAIYLTDTLVENFTQDELLKVHFHNTQTNLLMAVNTPSLDKVELEMHAEQRLNCDALEASKNALILITNDDVAFMAPASLSGLTVGNMLALITNFEGPLKVYSLDKNVLLDGFLRLHSSEPTDLTSIMPQRRRIATGGANNQFRMCKPPLTSPEKKIHQAHSAEKKKKKGSCVIS